MMDRLNSHRTHGVRRLGGLLVPLLAVVIGGCSAASAPATPQQQASPTGSSTGSEAIGAPAVNLAGPSAAQVPAGTETSSAGGASGSSNMAIAYPYPGLGGSAGLAPDHELVVSGTGWATVKVDLSDRTTAQRSALAAALADAKQQAQAAAADAGVTLGGVISMSVSVGGGYAIPMGVIEAPGSAPSGGGSTSVPPVPPVPGGIAPNNPTTQQLEVTVTVAYTIS
jgi:Protein of unknown function (DUF541)